MRNEQVSYGEIELEVIKNERDRQEQEKIDQEKRELGLDRVQEYSGKFIQRRALID